MWMVGIFATSAAIRHVQTIQSTNVAALSAHNWMELQVEPSEFQTDAGSGGVLLVLTRPRGELGAGFHHVNRAAGFDKLSRERAADGT